MSMQYELNSALECRIFVWPIWVKLIEITRRSDCSDIERSDVHVIFPILSSGYSLREYLLLSGPFDNVFVVVILAYRH